MQVFTLLFDTSGNGTYVKAFKTRNKALSYLSNWDDDYDMPSIIAEIEKEGYYHDEEGEFSIILESHNI
jgi:hypothetical protein